MSLCRLVVEMITERGCGTVDHLMPHLSELGYTRAQVIKAMHNARHIGYLWSEGKASRKGINRGKECPAVYWPTAKRPDPHSPILHPQLVQPTPMVASVFELASPRTSWPSLPTGTIYRPLGGWNSEDRVV